MISSISLSHSKPDWQKHFPVFLEECKKAGVRHLIKLSFYHAQKADDFDHVPLVKAHGECDKMLMDMIQPSVEPSMEGDTDVSIDYAKPHSKCSILCFPSPRIFVLRTSINDENLINFHHSLFFFVTFPPSVSYTILYASHLMSNPFTFQGKELYNDTKPCSYYGASGNHGVNYV